MKETKFKQTEVGMIPSDWEVKEFKSVATLINGRAYSQFELLDRGKYRVLRVGNFGTNDSWYYSNLELPEKMYCEKGDLLYCWSCTYGAYIWNQEKTIYHYHIWKVANLKAEKKYLQYILNNDVVQQMNSSNGSTMAHITKGFLENRLFAFPPTNEEQQRIANALSDVDTLIASLEKLIAKKKNIKQGAMQQLLTGRKRLPAFAHAKPTYKQTELGPIPSDWNVLSVSSIGKVITGSTPPRNDASLWNGSFNWISAQDFKQKEIFESIEKITVEGKNYCRLLPRNSVLVTCIASIGLNAITRIECATNQQINAIVPNKEIDPDYVYYTVDFGSARLKSIAGQTAVPIINKQQFEDFVIVIPSSKEEQTAIANILSDMDSEIQTLETKLEKYRKLKTGMMQQLLTGKIRLVD